MGSRGREQPTDLPYTGALGQTRTETVLVTRHDGQAHRMEIVRSLNVATDPSYAGAALDGLLNVDDGGVELAVPYVYHDPGARWFVLVVPTC